MPSEVVAARLERESNWVVLGKSILAEGTAGAEALSQDGDWLVPMISDEASVAKQSEREGLIQAGSF